MTRTHDAAANRVKFGRTKGETLKTRAEADKAANEHAQARTQLTRARMTLAQAIASVGIMLPQAIDPWPDVPALSDAGAHDDAWLQGRPDLLAAQRRHEQAQDI